MNPASCSRSFTDLHKHLPGNIDDCFYDYMPLDFDDGKDAAGHVGYVGYKVLAVTYGGTLKLYGQKGVSPLSNSGPTVDYSSGRSWGHLLGSVVPGATTITVDRLVYWEGAHDTYKGDYIVLTTTDYLPGHSEQLQVKKVTRNSDGTTTLDLQTPVLYWHVGETYDLSNVPAGVGPDKDTNVKCTAGQTRCIETRGGDRLADPQHPHRCGLRRVRAGISCSRQELYG